MRPKAPPRGRKNHRRTINEGHLRMIRQLPCILSGRPAEAAHISYGDQDHAKAHNAMGIRASDCYVVPLCPELHRLYTGSQHHSSTGEREWWQQFGVNPVDVSLRLWRCGRNLECQRNVIHSVRLDAQARDRVRSILEKGDG